MARTVSELLDAVQTSMSNVSQAELDETGQQVYIEQWNETIASDQVAWDAAAQLDADNNLSVPSAETNAAETTHKDDVAQLGDISDPASNVEPRTENAYLNFLSDALNTARLQLQTDINELSAALIVQKKAVDKSLIDQLIEESVLAKESALEYVPFVPDVYVNADGYKNEKVTYIGDHAEFNYDATGPVMSFSNILTRIQNVQEPTNDCDAANKFYVDQKRSEMIDASNTMKLNIHKLLLKLEFLYQYSFKLSSETISGVSDPNDDPVTSASTTVV